MFLDDDVQITLRSLNKISEHEVVKKQGDLYIAINVLSGKNRIMQGENHLIENLMSEKKHKKILKG